LTAGIAHIGAIDSTFSHNALVYIDDAGRAFTVEAYLERGAIVQPLADFLDHDLGRVVVLRHPDAALAELAAAAAYHRVAHGEPIHYDGGLDHTDGGERLFCSEIGPWAYAQAGGPPDLPLHPTRYPREQNPAFFDAMGLPQAILTAPADLLFDPRFQLVGEWRDLGQLETMRRHDAIAESLFTWMERDGYALSPRWSHRATVDVGLGVRRTPLLGSLVADRLHPHSERDFLITGLALQQAGELLWHELQPRIDAEETPTRERLLAELQLIRDEDLAAGPRGGALHRVLRPPMR
jgi:hypothetical protein